MSSVWDSTYLVVDLETTGPDTDKDRITDIACILVQSGEITHDYASLVNPHLFIPPYIARMTGISNEMAFRAPEASIILREAETFFPTKNGIFVAHNVKFDWTFLKTSFNREKIHLPAIPQLCTLKLAKRLLPSLLKKNVGALAKYFGIPMVNKHRAYEDAKATALILIELLEIAETDHQITDPQELLRFQNHLVKNVRKRSPGVLKTEEFANQAPNSPGVYYFRSAEDTILYVGKAKSLRNRLQSYFHTPELASPKTTDMIRQASKITWVETESELHALILESSEIKDIKPPFNVVDKRYKRYPFIKISIEDDYPRIFISYNIIDDNAEYYGPFRNAALVEEIIKMIDINFKLRKCEHNLVPDLSYKPCLQFQIERCNAPCALRETKEEYSKEIIKVRDFLSLFSDCMLKDLESKMQDFSEKLEFEKAGEIKDQILELKRVFYRQHNFPTTLNQNNIIVVSPNDAQEKTIDIFFIRCGILVYHKIIGRLADKSDIYEKIQEIYYPEEKHVQKFTNKEIEEIRIINSWIYKHKERNQLIYINDNFEKIIAKFDEKVKNANFDDIPESY